LVIKKIKVGKLIKKIIPKIDINLIFIISLVAFIYLISYPFILKFNNENIPQGDPYTYTNGWLIFINNLNNHHYLTNIFHILTNSGWYLYQNILLTILYPLIQLKVESIALINFVPFTIAMLIIYKIFKKLFSKEIGILIALLYALMPWHHGLDQATSLFSLQLDSIYVNTLTPTILLLAMHLITDQQKKNLNVLTGIFMGLTVWSRANSIIPLILVIILFALHKFKLDIEKIYTFVKDKKTSFIIFSSMTLYYYLRFYKIVINYYSGLNNYVHFNKDLFFNHLLTIPSIFIYGIHFNNKNLIEITSLILYIFMVVETYIAILEIKNKKNIEINKLIIFSVNVFFTIFLLYVYRFHSLDLWQGYIVILGPLFIFFSCIAAKKLSQVHIKNKFIITTFVFVILTTILYNTYLNTPPLEFNKNKSEHVFDPKKLSKFSNEIEMNFPKKKIASFYYGDSFNVPLLNYYRLLSGNKELSIGAGEEDLIYTNQYTKNAWNLTSTKTKEETKKFIYLTFKDANYIVIANKKECYDGYHEPTYSIYSNSKYIYDALNENIKNFSIKDSFISGNCTINIWERISKR